MLKYAHRLENTKDGLLYDAYICNKKLHANNITTWFSSIDYLMKELDLPNLNVSVGRLCTIVKNKLCTNFHNHWKEFRENTVKSGRGKLLTYFSIEYFFGTEKCN